MPVTPGSTVTLRGEYRDGAGNLVDPTGQAVSILGPTGAVLVAPTPAVRDSLGLYHYDYAVPAGAALGTYTARWTGTIGGAAVTGDETFDVVAATPPATPLVSEATYRRLTGDTATSSAAVVAALADAQAALQDALHRPLVSAVRTEVVKVWPDGLVYPAAQPVTVVPAGALVDGGAVRGGWVTDALGVTTLTYTGGWTSATIPMPLVQAICSEARELLSPAVTALVGARKYAVGDVSVERDSAVGEISTWPKSVLAYRRRSV